MAERALMFSGQGAQFVGMGKDLADAYPECRALYERADDVLGFSLSAICFDGPEEELTKSSYCQPAIFVTSLACRAALAACRSDVTFLATGGLSLGEWTALHAAGALSYEDTLRVLESRGRFMQEACEATRGGMVSVMGLPLETLEEICSASGVTIANLNSAEQVVLSGEKGAIEKAEALAKEAGARRTVLLNVAGAFHSPLMASAAEQLAGVLESVEIVEPATPVVANVTGEPHGTPEEIRRAMLAQVTSPVRWLSCVEWLRGRGVSTYVECGPGKVLSGLVKRIDRGASLHNIQDVPSLEAAAQAL
ncbi:MAG: ACP S-malonyltransferase [Lentisphaerae bacterium]|nr:ACP S-malonyltransferase [Lentisphaerota bacterium]